MGRKGTALILTVMCLVTFMAILDTSLVNLGIGQSRPQEHPTESRHGHRDRFARVNAGGCGSFLSRKLVGINVKRGFVDFDLP
jgi:hypothetical protein